MFPLHDPPPHPTPPEVGAPRGVWCATPQDTVGGRRKNNLFLPRLRWVDSCPAVGRSVELARARPQRPRFLRESNHANEPYFVALHLILPE